MLFKMTNMSRDSSSSSGLSFQPHVLAFVPREALLTGAFSHEERHHHDEHKDGDLDEEGALDAHNANDGPKPAPPTIPPRDLAVNM